VFDSAASPASRLSKSVLDRMDSSGGGGGGKTSVEEAPRRASDGGELVGGQGSADLCLVVLHDRPQSLLECRALFACNRRLPCPVARHLFGVWMWCGYVAGLGVVLTVAGWMRGRFGSETSPTTFSNSPNLAGKPKSGSRRAR